MNAQVKKYVVGFAFSPNYQDVLLIEKRKPAWQAGKLNGIGGKIESGEQPIDAMVREFREECGLQTTVSDWLHFMHMHGGENDDGGKFEVHFFCTTTAAIHSYASLTSEPVEIEGVNNITPLRLDMVENLPWCIALAIDSHKDGRPKFTNCIYP